MKILLACLIILVSATGLANSNSFILNGRPIRPSCLALFNSTRVPEPLVHSVDLSFCQRSQLTNQKIRITPNGQWYSYNNGKDDADGAYYYKYIGATANGVKVLHTYQSGGGSGLFDGLLLLRVSDKKLPVYYRGGQFVARQSVVADLVGFVRGGDRCSGGIKRVEIHGKKIKVVQYPAINSAAQCRGERIFQIDTASWVVTH